MHLCGVYLNRGRIILTVIFLPLVFFMIYSEEILILLGQDKDVSKYAVEYIKPMIIGMYFLGQFDLTRRFLMCL